MCVRGVLSRKQGNKLSHQSFFFTMGRPQGLRYRNEGGRTTVPPGAASGSLSSPSASGAEGAAEGALGGAGGALGGGGDSDGQTGAKEGQNDQSRGCSMAITFNRNRAKSRYTKNSSLCRGGLRG